MAAVRLIGAACLVARLSAVAAREVVEGEK